jgi:adenine deaminase
MSNLPLDSVVDSLEQLKEKISSLGTNRDILMSLHFIQLAVIPSIKITDLGLVDVMKQELINLFA